MAKLYFDFDAIFDGSIAKNKGFWIYIWIETSVVLKNQFKSIRVQLRPTVKSRVENFRKPYNP